MPPRIRLRSLKQLADLQIQKNTYICSRCQYATATATVPAPSGSQMGAPPPSISRYSPSQPPSHRDPVYRKSQLLRSYVSLLQSTPLILLFQHNNLKANEWAGIRRELTSALKKVDEQLAASPGGDYTPLCNTAKLQIVQTNMLEPALRIAEYYNPQQHFSPPSFIPSERFDPTLRHALSESAYLATKEKRNLHELTALLAGPIAVLTFAAVSPQHLHAALSILSPQAPKFPAPTRRLNPSYWDPPVQDGLKKLMLLGARVEGRVFDNDGTRWVGGIEGDIEGLRAQLVGMLQGFSGSLASTLETASRSLWLTMEGRRSVLEEEQKPKNIDGQT